MESGIIHASVPVMVTGFVGAAFFGSSFSILISPYVHVFIKHKGKVDHCDTTIEL
ncbi:hypothetical protein FHS14_005497 [Paenibacillus baekrokdamisoli]|nr:hypothetical protein [Paenibacillus baekrokdamisoli]